MSGFGAPGREESESTSSSTSGSGGSDRGNLYVKGRYGTKTFGPETECEFCDERAFGVVKAKKDGLVTLVPVCESKFEEIDENTGGEVPIERWDDE